MGSGKIGIWECWRSSEGRGEWKMVFVGGGGMGLEKQASIDDNLL